MRIVAEPAIFESFPKMASLFWRKLQGNSVHFAKHSDVLRMTYRVMNSKVVCYKMWPQKFLWSKSFREMQNECFCGKMGSFKTMDCCF
jgi:hypothetical protein